MKVKAEDLGPIEKQITVATNDPHHAAVTLFIKAVAKPEIGLSEPTIVFENTGKEARKEIILTIPAAKPIRVVSAFSTDPNIVVSLEPVSGSNGRQMKLIAIRKPDTGQAITMDRSL